MPAPNPIQIFSEDRALQSVQSWGADLVRYIDDWRAKSDTLETDYRAVEARPGFLQAYGKVLSGATPAIEGGSKEEGEDDFNFSLSTPSTALRVTLAFGMDGTDWSPTLVRASTSALFVAVNVVSTTVFDILSWTATDPAVLEDLSTTARRFTFHVAGKRLAV